jgi:arsenite methyltransferase
MSTVPQDGEKLREEVRERYGRTALQVLGTGEPATDGCCGTSSNCCGTSSSSAVTSDLYSSRELGELPVAAALASLGCGNPTALAEQSKRLRNWTARLLNLLCFADILAVVPSLFKHRIVFL